MIYYCAFNEQVFAIQSKTENYNHNTLLNKINGEFLVEYHYNISDFIEKKEIKIINVKNTLIYTNKELAECRLLSIDNLIAQYSYETFDNFHKFGKIINNKPIGRWWFMFSDFRFGYIVDFEDSNCVSYKFDENIQCIIEKKNYNNYILTKSQYFVLCFNHGRFGTNNKYYTKDLDDSTFNYNINKYFYPIPPIDNYKPFENKPCNTSSDSSNSSNSSDSDDSSNSSDSSNSDSSSDSDD